ncbi:MAG: alpha/beta hydrolase family protein [Pyrinomonadaceae bacterium]
MSARTNFFLGCILAVASLSFAPTVAAQNLTFEDVKKFPVPPGAQRFSYGSDPSQFGELRLPQGMTKGKGSYPVVVVIHGGCWYSEYDLSQVASFYASLAGLGVPRGSLEYRRIGNPRGGWPGTFTDVARGTDHLRVLARSFPLDLTRVIVVGHSAGGQLALWLAARQRLPKSSSLYTNNPLTLRGIVSLAGITDLRSYRPNCGDAVTKLLGGSPEAVSDRYRQTSSIELLPLKIEQRLIHGALDEIVPADFSKDYAAAAGKKGDSVRLTIVPNAGHFDSIAPKSSSWAAVENAVRSLLTLKKR